MDTQTVSFEYAFLDPNFIHTIIFMIHPKLDEGEKMIVALKDHWVTLVMPVFLYVIGFTLAIIIAGTAILFFPENEIIRGVLLLVAISVNILVHNWMFIYLFEHEIPAWIITNKRVVAFQYLPYVKHDVSFIMISELHEIDKRKHGLSQNILNYGDVIINLAATPTSVIFHYVPRTGAFVNLLETLHKTPPDVMDIERMKQNYFA
jgi:hypothetical protein